ncbi:hypothetical protein TrLO_g15925 [Triparma laevis f. longispina]|uniref:SWIM-type domain-containing protein n=1 Tax=Triparma laevis f. longispina TaxID=1714387 RepID=A0A9W7E0Y7_9STRA|nr:hypothetical protein TrLO_g15925 [Triparma laevis f. longispina]
MSSPCPPIPSSPLSLIKSYTSSPSPLPPQTYLSKISSLLPPSTLQVLDDPCSLIRYVSMESGRVCWVVKGYVVVGDWCGCKSYLHGRGEGCKHIYAKYASLGLSNLQTNPLTLHSTVEIPDLEFGQMIDRTLQKS